MSEKKTQVDDPKFIDSFFGGAVTEGVSLAAPEVDAEDKDKKRPGFLDNQGGDVSLGNLIGEKEGEEGDEEEDEIISKSSSTEGKEEKEEKELSEDDTLSFSEMNSYNNDTEDVQGVEALDVAISSLIEEGEIFGYEEVEGEDPFKIDTPEKVKALIKANKEEWKKQYLTEELEKDLSAFPDEFKYVLDYIKAGGTSPREVLQSILNIEEVRSINVDSEKDSESLTKAYLSVTGFGTEEEIDEQILEWKDLDVLDKKANQFKPKLETLEKKKIEETIAQERKVEQQRRDLANQYFEGVSGALKDRKINGLTLTAKEAVDLQNDLIKNNYVSSISNKPINYLGKVLEDISWANPDYEFLAELTLFAKDREGYRNKVKKEIEQEIVSKNEAKLKLKTVRPVNSGSINTNDRSATLQKKKKRRNFLST